MEQIGWQPFQSHALSRSLEPLVFPPQSGVVQPYPWNHHPGAYQDHHAPNDHRRGRRRQPSSLWYQKRNSNEHPGDLQAIVTRCTNAMANEFLLKACSYDDEASTTLDKLADHFLLWQSNKAKFQVNQVKGVLAQFVGKHLAHWRRFVEPPPEDELSTDIAGLSLDSNASGAGETGKEKNGPSTASAATAAVAETEAAAEAGATSSNSANEGGDEDEAAKRRSLNYIFRIKLLPLTEVNKPDPKKLIQAQATMPRRKRGRARRRMNTSHGDDPRLMRYGGGGGPPHHIRMMHQAMQMGGMPPAERAGGVNVTTTPTAVSGGGVPMDAASVEEKVTAGTASSTSSQTAETHRSSSPSSSEGGLSSCENGSRRSGDDATSEMATSTCGRSTRSAPLLRSRAGNVASGSSSVGSPSRRTRCSSMSTRSSTASSMLGSPMNRGMGSRARPPVQQQPPMFRGIAPGMAPGMAPMMPPAVMAPPAFPTAGFMPQFFPAQFGMPGMPGMPGTVNPMNMSMNMMRPANMNMMPAPMMAPPGHGHGQPFGMMKAPSGPGAMQDPQQQMMMPAVGPASPAAYQQPIVFLSAPFVQNGPQTPGAVPTNMMYAWPGNPATHPGAQPVPPAAMNVAPQAMFAPQQPAVHPMGGRIEMPHMAAGVRGEMRQVGPSVGTLVDVNAPKQA